MRGGMVMVANGEGAAGMPAAMATFGFSGSDRRGPPQRMEPLLEIDFDEPPPPAARRSPITVSRSAVPFIDLMRPEMIPSASAIATSLGAAAREACRAELAQPSFDLRKALSALIEKRPPAAGRGGARSVHDIEPDRSADLETHDQFFRIRRVQDGEPAALLCGLLRSLRVLRADIEETPTGMDPDRIVRMADAILATVAAMLGCESTTGFFHWRRSHAEPHPDLAVRRWIRGHQIFATLSQCLLFALRAMEEADAADDAAAVRRYADLFADLLAASASSLELTGDFPDEVYRESIRVSMESPYLPSGFSGLLSSDHRELVLRMKTMRPTIDRLRARHEDKHRRIVDALAAVYASHGSVCARFVGVDRSSLLMSSSIGRSAVDQIDRFKQMRMRSWEPTGQTSE